MAIITSPISIAAGREYREWAVRLSNAMRELVASGEAPAFMGLEDFFDLSNRLSLAMKNAADQAARNGAETFTLELPLTDAEHRLLYDMGGSLLSYVEILTLRGKFDATTTPAVDEAIAAISGTPRT